MPPPSPTCAAMSRATGATLGKRTPEPTSRRFCTAPASSRPTPCQVPPGSGSSPKRIVPPPPSCCPRSIELPLLPPPPGPLLPETQGESHPVHRGYRPGEPPHRLRPRPRPISPLRPPALVRTGRKFSASSPTPSGRAALSGRAPSRQDRSAEAPSGSLDPPTTGRQGRPHQLAYGRLLIHVAGVSSQARLPTSPPLLPCLCSPPLTGGAFAPSLPACWRCPVRDSIRGPNSGSLVLSHPLRTRRGAPRSTFSALAPSQSLAAFAGLPGFA